MEELDLKDLEGVAGGALPMSKTYKFHCKKCRYDWQKATANPSKEHGCPRCGWWYNSLKDNGNPEQECVIYDPTPIG